MTEDRLSAVEPTEERSSSVTAAVGAWALALLPFVLLVALSWSPGPPGDATDAYHYLLHGRALAEGAGYSNTGYIFSALNPWIGPRVQPPGMAIVLYPVFKLFGANVLLMRLVVVACAIAFLVLAGRSFARLDGVNAGLSVTLLSGLVPALAAFASNTYSDLVSAAAIWAVIYVVDSTRRFDAIKLALITVIGGMALITRLTGVSLVAALLLFAVLRYREFGWRPFVPLGIWALGGLLALSTVGPVIPIWALDGFAMIRQWFGILATYRFGFLEIMLYPFASNLANDVYHVISFLLVVLGFFAWIRRGWNRFVTLFVVSYVAMLASLPISGGGRYLWPVAPFVLFCLLKGIETVLRVLVPRLTPARLQHAVLASAVVLALLSAARLVFIGRQPALIEDPVVQEIVDRVRGLAAEDNVRVAFEYPRLLTWETRVPAMGLPRNFGEVTVDEMVDELRSQRITHLVSFERVPGTDRQRVVQELLQGRSEMFVLRHRGGSFAIYEIE